MIGAVQQPCDQGLARAGEAATPCSAADAPWILAATILGSGMVFIDGTVANVALPALQADLGATSADAQWVVEAYALFLAALLLVGGSLGDRFGRRRVFQAGVVLFAASSIGCGLAANVAQLVFARALQGVGAALLVPGSLAIISASFPQALRGRAIGTWSGFTSITAALGPLMGGWLIDHASWRWAFLINVPVAIVVLAITRRHVAESRAPRAAGQDWAGAALAALALGGLVFGLIEASSRGWTDARVIGGLLLGAGALSVFVLWEARARSPMLPLGLFRSREFSGANLLTLLLYAALGGGLYFLPLNLIQVQGYSATAAGAALLPFILIMFGLSRWAGGLVDRRGAKLPLTVGPVIAAFGFLLLCLPGTSGSYWTTFFPAVLVLGVGMGISVAPLTTTVMGAVSDDLAGTASGVNNAASRVAAVLAIAVFGVVVAVVFNRTLDQRLAPLALAPEALRALDAERAKLAGAQLPRGLDPAQRAAARQAIKESYVAGFRRTMLACCGLALLGALTGWSMIGGKPRVTPASAPPP